MACETFITISEEDFFVIGIATATSALPRIAWGLIWSYVSQHFKVLLERNGLPIIRFHDLRHSTATYLLSLGFNMKECSMWLGHSDIGTTMNIYSHISTESKRNMADMLDDRYGLFG